MSTEKQRQDARDRYAMYKSRGICALCGQRDAVKGKALCDTCLRTKCGHSVIDYYRQKDKGVCIKCRKPTEGNQTRCPECAAKKIAYHKELYQQRKEKGLCVKCGGKRSDKRFTRCEKCRAKLRNNYHAKAA